jgi:hypothetical protein
MANELIFKLSFLSKIADSLAGDLHKEKEFRADLNKLPPECDGIKPIIIKQGILREVKDCDKVITYCRIRSKQEPGRTAKYSLGVKNFNKNEESESEISKETFDAWYPDNLNKPQEKKRYKLPNGWTIDDIDDGKIVAEYEYKNKSDIPDVPQHWK